MTVGFIQKLFSSNRPPTLLRGNWYSLNSILCTFSAKLHEHFRCQASSCTVLLFPFSINRPMLHNHVWVTCGVCNGWENLELPDWQAPWEKCSSCNLSEGFISLPTTSAPPLWQPQLLHFYGSMYCTMSKGSKSSCYGLQWNMWEQ